MINENYYNILDEEVYRLAQELLQQNYKTFRSLNSYYQLNNIRSWYNKFDKYESEMEITFYYNNDIFDILEFFVYENGEPAADITEIKKWLIENIYDIIKKLETENKR